MPSKAQQSPEWIVLAILFLHAADYVPTLVDILAKIAASSYGFNMPMNCTCNGRRGTEQRALER